MTLKVSIKKQLSSFLLDVDFVCEKRITAVLGGTAVGKTQTLEAIAGLSNIDEGHIECDGRVLCHKNPGFFQDQVH